MVTGWMKSTHLNMWYLVEEFRKMNNKVSSRWSPDFAPSGVCYAKKYCTNHDRFSRTPCWYQCTNSNGTEYRTLTSSSRLEEKATWENRPSIHESKKSVGYQGKKNIDHGKGSRVLLLIMMWISVSVCLGYSNLNQQEWTVWYGELNRLPIYNLILNRGPRVIFSSLTNEIKG